MGGRRRSFTQKRRSIIPDDFSYSPGTKTLDLTFGTYDLDWDLEFGLGLVNTSVNPLMDPVIKFVTLPTLNTENYLCNLYAMVNTSLQSNS